MRRLRRVHSFALGAVSLLFPLKISAPRVTIGRSGQRGPNFVAVQHQCISKAHCVLERDLASTATSVPLVGPDEEGGSVIWVTDLSRNGTFVAHAGELIRLRRGVRTAIQLPPSQVSTAVLVV